MLKTHPDRVCAFLAVDFDPIVSFATRLGDAAEVAHARLKTPHWGFGTGKYVFRDPTTRLVVVLDFRRIFFQSLGLEPWIRNGDLYADVMLACLQKMGITKVKRVGFNTQAYLPLGMSHKEMADLMPGSFLASSSDLDEVCGKFEDVLLQLHGVYDTSKLQLIVAPMTKEQATQQFMATHNLEAFLEPKLADPGIQQFRDRVAVDCFHVSADLFRTDISDVECSRFLKQAVDAADRITDGAVLKLKSLRAKR